MDVASDGAAPEPDDQRPAPTRGVWEKLADRSHDYAHDRVIRCGWGRILFAQTFDGPERLVEELRREAEGQRDIAFYVHEPHVLVGHAPQEVFLDPSHTYRADLTGTLPEMPQVHGVRIDVARGRSDLLAVDAILRRRGMVPIVVDELLRGEDADSVTWFLARRERDFEPVGAVMGVDHARAFDDPERGSSLWSLAVDPSADRPGIGEALVLHLLRYYAERGARYLDLSVVHDNESAIRLYDKLGFQQVPIFCVKRKNTVNEPLFVADTLPEMNPYADLIVREALRRGILVEVLDRDAALFRLTHGGRSVVCRESLSEMTSAIAMTRCADKTLTHRLLTRAGISMPEQQVATGEEEQQRAFLDRHGRIVVKPAHGEQGFGVHVGLDSPEEVADAVASLRAHGLVPILEEMVEGQDLRTIVIGGELVAAAVRRPAQVVGTGRHSVRQLIERQSRRRAAATGGESRIPIDAETERLVGRAGHTLESVLPEGETLVVRSTANLHSGGTMHDVTDVLHPELVAVSRRIADILDIPVVGLDLIVADPERPNYKLIEANERPGLANHEPQPTAERFVDLLFPATISASPTT